MNDNKRYYWIKLKTDFFNQSEIDFLLAQPNGCEYIRCCVCKQLIKKGN